MYNNLESKIYELRDNIVELIGSVQGLQNVCPQVAPWLDPLRRYAVALNKYPFGTQNLELIREYKKQLITPLNEVIIVGKSVVKTMPSQLQQSMYNMIADQEGVLKKLKE